MPINGHFTPSEIRHAHDIAAYIEQHYNEKITLEQLSYEAGLDPKLLQKVFANVKGTTMHQYQLVYRLQKIKDDLQEFDWSIEGIARKHGFASPKYFYRFFKKHEGMTAQEYRLKLMIVKKDLEF